MHKDEETNCVWEGGGGGARVKEYIEHKNKNTRRCAGCRLGEII